MINSLQGLIYQQLTQKGYKVYDIIDENTEMPYIKIGDTNFSDKILRTGEKFYYISWELFYCYDGSNKGRKEINYKYIDIYNTLYELIHKEINDFIVLDCKLNTDSNNSITEHIINENTTIYLASINFNFILQRR